MKIGIFFGGQSREREVSFAGGRTVFDNLDKDLFEAVPIFVDSLGNFIHLNWQYIYKGTIRDFYPPSKFDRKNKHAFQVYVESLNLSPAELAELISEVGEKIEPSQFSTLFDFAFLALHGPQGEDGSIQGILEWYGIPYSGSGIYPSATGIDKVIQKNSLDADPSNFLTLSKDDWDSSEHKEAIFDATLEKLGKDIVVKAPHQGSSIGISVLQNVDFNSFSNAIEKALFRMNFDLKSWKESSIDEKVREINAISDIRSGIGFPLYAKNELIIHPEELFEFFANCDDTRVNLKSIYSEENILIEKFIDGEEFSCIVIEDDNGKVIALPPTQIKKPSEIFDYRAKYLPGISRKITPIDLAIEQIKNIREKCEDLYRNLHGDVYARLDGFINDKGEITLNDPNTTSGMLPSSFFFHQAAEIGLNPSQFLTFIIRNSLKARIKSSKYSIFLSKMLEDLDEAIQRKNTIKSDKESVAVIMGGFSSERHISVESGRNIYEKLSSSSKYSPFPVFLSGSLENHVLHEIPVNIMLKDNADDIKEKIEHFKIHPIIEEIRNETQEISLKYSGKLLQAPNAISYADLAKKTKMAFIALHGRPGEDGSVQRELEKFGMAYNGSLPSSSEITINKFETNEILRKHGVLVAHHQFVKKHDWKSNAEVFYAQIEKEFPYPLIAKPADDGCSSAVAKIKNRESLEAYSTLIFRDNEELDKAACDTLKISYKEEFPIKNGYVIETLIDKGEARHFLEITGGLLTHIDDSGSIDFEMFEPSEALAIGEILSLEEKFLAGEGQNITPARYDQNPELNKSIAEKVKLELKKVCEILNIQGYARIDAFVRIFEKDEIEVFIIEVNSLPGMTPATCIFHQSAINEYTPLQFISSILEFGKKRIHNTIA